MPAKHVFAFPHIALERWLSTAGCQRASNAGGRPAVDNHRFDGSPFFDVAGQQQGAYTRPMQKKSLFDNNPHLKNASAYQQALRVNVLSSMAIEGVRKAAEKALPPTVGKPVKA
jgi:hypothetical protein